MESEKDQIEFKVGDAVYHEHVGVCEVKEIEEDKLWVWYKYRVNGRQQGFDKKTAFTLLSPLIKELL